MPVVYRFTMWDNLAGRRITPQLKCTLARIGELRGEAIPNTAEEVDDAELDHGCAVVASTLRDNDGSGGKTFSPRRKV